VLTINHPRLLSLAKRFIKFGTVGGSGVVVNTGLLFLFTEKAGIDYRISSLLAIEFSIINNFLWNNLWTWRDNPAIGRNALIKRFLAFNFSSGLVALVVNWGILLACTELTNINYNISNLIGIACGTMINFTVSHRWTFGKNTRQAGP
jgi:dolichol-phosphate mannosyltransferase